MGQSGGNSLAAEHWKRVTALQAEEHSLGIMTQGGAALALGYRVPAFQAEIK